MHCITIKCMWMITQILRKYAAWLLEYQAKGVLLLGRQEHLCVLKAELIDLHSLLQTCTDLQYKLADLLSISGHAFRL